MPGFIDFKALAEQIDIEAVAQLCGLGLKRSGKELRSACPACKSDDERALAVMPESNSFRCYSAGQSGDCIALYAHLNGTGMYKAAKELQEHFGTATAARTAPATAPQKPEGRDNGPTSRPAPAKKPEATFDAEAYIQKLTYSDEVAALGISEEDAARLSIGYSSTGLMRGRVCIPVRNPDGSISGFIGWDGKDLKVPKTWLTSNVVTLKRRA